MGMLLRTGEHSRQVVRIQTTKGYDRLGEVVRCDSALRSYIVRSNGGEYCRNRQHLLTVPETLPPETPIEASVPVVQAQPADSPVIEPRNIPAPMPVCQARVKQQQQAATSISPRRVVTRSGRISKPNPKYKD